MPIYERKVPKGEKFAGSNEMTITRKGSSHGRALEKAKGGKKEKAWEPSADFFKSMRMVGRGTGKHRLDDLDKGIVKKY